VGELDCGEDLFEFSGFAVSQVARALESYPDSNSPIRLMGLPLSS
jgi:hypothetical protein